MDESLLVESSYGYSYLRVGCLLFLLPSTYSAHSAFFIFACSFSYLVLIYSDYLLLTNPREPLTTRPWRSCWPWR